jgi:hypothetical protein
MKISTEKAPVWNSEARISAGTVYRCTGLYRPVLSTEHKHRAADPQDSGDTNSRVCYTQLGLGGGAMQEAAIVYTTSERTKQR